MDFAVGTGTLSMVIVCIGTHIPNVKEAWTDPADVQNDAYMLLIIPFPL